VSIQEDVRAFLTTRRAKVTPHEAGLPEFGGKRRVPGLRREEVALLAGVSVDYYVRLERGNLAGVSDQVLDAVAQALRLDDAERAHLHDLARTCSGPVRRSKRAPVSKVRPGILRILEATSLPAYVRNRRMDILAANDLAVALYGGLLERDNLPVNFARFLFLDHRAPELFLDWERVADSAAATLRAEAGRDPYDKNLTDLIGELVTRSDGFRERWGRHNVWHHRSAVKRLRNPVVGDLELTGEALDLPPEGLTVVIYTAERDSPSAEALRLLASWSATGHPHLIDAREMERDD